jgi:predicted O-methyltransferase YrrM
MDLSGAGVTGGGKHPGSGVLMQEVDYTDWHKGKSFTTDWTSPHVPIWTELLSGRRHHSLNVLEIGSWEGRSTIFFLNYLPHSRITCVDTFGGSQEHNLPELRPFLEGVEERFDQNLAEFSERVEKIKGTSHRALPELALMSRRYDLTYVDGSHRAADVFSDAALAWPMVKPGGMLIFDDYTWNMMPDPIDRPQLGIDAFLASHAGQYREVHRGLQIAIEKN